MRVLELGSGVAVSYASKLLADEGADVIKVEGLDGDPLRRDGVSSLHSKPTAASGLFFVFYCHAFNMISCHCTVHSASSTSLMFIVCLTLTSQKHCTTYATCST